MYIIPTDDHLVDIFIIEIGIMSHIIRWTIVEPFEKYSFPLINVTIDELYSIQTELTEWSLSSLFLYQE